MKKPSDKTSPKTKKKPILVYDGDCSFCKLWVVYWHKLTESRVRYVSFEKYKKHIPEGQQSEFQEAVQFILPSGRRFSGAEAIFALLTQSSNPRHRRWNDRYLESDLFADFTEWVYDRIANRRSLAYRISTTIWGQEITPITHHFVRAIFLRLLALVYLIAFFSLTTQITALIGTDGLSPATDYLNRISDNHSTEKYWLVPSLAWLNSSSFFIYIYTISGVIFSVIAIIGLAQGPAFLLLWLLYLSILSISPPFLNFQWDILLLEAGFLAFLFAPWRTFPSRKVSLHPSRLIVFAYRFLLFRLMFFSGIVKLQSGDHTWRNLTALKYHYETQPLPNPVSWYMHQIPTIVHQATTVGMFFIELVVPFFFFGPQKIRRLAGILTAVLQLAIIITGNYTFFNFLTLVLIIPLLDDRDFKLLPLKFSINRTNSTLARQVVTTTIVSFIILLGFFQVSHTTLPKKTPALINKVIALANPVHVVNSYGLFRVMTTERFEIVIEGSNDKKSWEEYEFMYKPGNINRRPSQVAPHQPRLDWQMWFAALGNYQQNPWFINLINHLLKGSPHVLALLDHNPFPNNPPQFIRAVRYRYTFTNSAIKGTRDEWWKREATELYLPVVTRESLTDN